MRRGWKDGQIGFAVPIGLWDVEQKDKKGLLEEVIKCHKTLTRKIGDNQQLCITYKKLEEGIVLL